MSAAEPDSPTFDFTAGALCLDFTNTWEDRQQPDKDHLCTFSDWIHFAHQASIVGDRDLDLLDRWRSSDSREVHEALDFAHRVREVLFRVFVAHVQNQIPTTDDLDRLNWALSESLPHLRLRRDDRRYRWTWNGKIDSPMALIRPVLQSSADLLTSDRLPRLRLCGGECCTWLFLDQSRNHSRRWCSMETCGNRAKAKRHYQRCQENPPTVNS